MLNTRRLNLAALALAAFLWAGASKATPQTPNGPRPSGGTPENTSGASRSALNGNVPSEPTDNIAPEPSVPDQIQAELKDIQERLNSLEAKAPDADSTIDVTPIAPIWLSAAGVVFGVLGLIAAIGAQLQLRRSHLLLRHQADALRTRLSTLEIQVEQDRVVNRSRPSPKEPIQEFQAMPTRPQNAQPTVPLPPPPPAAVILTAPPSLASKAGLISALNNGDRQQLRDAAKAELNITSESENAIAIGRIVATELEEVLGGGSYWLICLDGQHWLFPTDRTLKGFAAAQPNKGLYLYEQSLIASAQLVEPALLEQTGSLWCVKALGLIRTP